MECFPQATGKETSCETVPIPETPDNIDEDLIEATAAQVLVPMDNMDYINRHMELISTKISSSRSRQDFSCKLCSFMSKYKTVCISHVEKCLEKLEIANQTANTEEGNLNAPEKNSSWYSCGDEDRSSSSSLPDPSLPGISPLDGNFISTDDGEIEEDRFWNYKNGEFFLDSLFALSTIYEKFGDGLGMLIQ